MPTTPTQQARLRASDRNGVRLIEAAPSGLFNRAMRTELFLALKAAKSDPAVHAVVIETAGLGGEPELEDGDLQPDARALAEAIEGLSKPVIAFIDGRCEDSVFEMALAAHGRVARSRAIVGLGAIRLGLVPHAGATQRLPRLVGMEEALDMLLSGASRQADALKATALFDYVVGAGGHEHAFALAAALCSSDRLDGRRPPANPQDEAFLHFCRTTVTARKGAGPAAGNCVELAAASMTSSLERGLELEQRAFDALRASAPSKALRHISQAERAVAARADAAPFARPVGSVAVVGAGTMGSGIAMALANAGIPVLLLDESPAGLDRGLQSIVRHWAASVSKGRLSAQQAESRRGLIRTATTYRELAKADLFIEAVFERLDVKQQVLRAIDEVAPEGAVIASNTSGLDMDMLASFTRRPADVVGTHFFSPAHAMRLVEVVRGRATSQGTLSTVLALARRIAKLPVVVGVCDGFVGNRMLARYIAAADLLVRQGAAPEQVDAALERFGFAMGPFRMGDLAGLDVAQAGRRRRAAANPGRDYSQVADALCDAGRLGQKTGAGWYRYVDGSRTAHPDPAVAEIVQRWRDANGLRPRRIEEREIVERCVFALANEGARVLEEGIAGSAADIDVIYVNGYGFSSSRGGPMHFTQETGLTQVLCSLQAYASESGADPSWEPAPLLRRLAQSGAMHWNMKETAE